MSLYSNLGEINLGEFNLGDLTVTGGEGESTGNLTYSFSLVLSGTIPPAGTITLSYSFSINSSSTVLSSVFKESFDNPAYEDIDDLYNVGKWKSTPVGSIGSAYKYYGSQGVGFTYGQSIDSVDFPQLQTISFGFRVKFTGWANSPQFFGAKNNADFFLNYVFILTAVKVGSDHFLNLSPPNVNGTTPLQLDTWYYLSGKIYVHNTEGTYDIYLNDTIELSGVGDTRGGDNAYVEFVRLFVGSEVGSVSIDSLYILDGSLDEPLSECDVYWNGTYDEIVNSTKGTGNLDYSFSQLLEGTETFTGEGDLAYSFSQEIEAAEQFLSTIALLYEFTEQIDATLIIDSTGNLDYSFSVAGSGQLSFSGTGDVSYSFSIDIGGGTWDVLGFNSNVTYRFRMYLASKSATGSGNLTFTFSQAAVGTSEYSLANLTYSFLLSLVAAETVYGTISYSPPFGMSISGAVYGSNTELEEEMYLRRFINDTVGLSKDQSPVAVTYDEPADDETTDYLKNFLGVGH